MAEEAVAETARRLEACGQRVTPQRLAVIAGLMAQRRHITAQGLHAALRSVQPPLGLATVYRTLELLVDCGLAEAFPQPNNELAYTFCTAQHHHHLVCNSCGLVAEVPGCALRSVEQDLALRSHFTITDHAVTFFGTCQECQGRAPLLP